MILLLIFAFISGLFTILAPCIWPLLPIILSSSVISGSHRRPLGITLGIIVSFAVFTLTISSLVSLFHFDPNILRLFAVLVIGFLGLSIIIPKLGAKLELLAMRFTNRGGVRGQQYGDDFHTGFITGLSLGIVWSPCAGPILATIATLAATNTISFNLVLVTGAYVLGVGIPLFFFAYGGQQLVRKTRFISPYTGKLQTFFGYVMILTAISIFTNYDKVIQAKLLDFFPQYSQALTSFESNDKVKTQLDILKGKKPMQELKKSSSALPIVGTAPEFTGITKWLGVDKPLTMQKLKGKVVLIDFWTYTCINCIRTLPHLTSWYEKYKDKGFVIVGVHTPEFEFEKTTQNVENAMKQYNINYPVAQDNNFATWNAWNNSYWPAKYLVDKDGNIRYYHFGEGQYEETEKAIQDLLKEVTKDVPSDITNMPDKTPTTRSTPETYLGSKRMEFLFPGNKAANGTKTFTLPEDTPPDSFSLGGEWRISDEYAISSKNSVLILNFNAQNVYLVMRPSDSSTKTVKVFLDGKLVGTSNGGANVINGIVSVTKDDIYHLIQLLEKGNHILRLEFTPGIESYAFTFG